MLKWFPLQDYWWDNFFLVICYSQLNNLQFLTWKSKYEARGQKLREMLQNVISAPTLGVNCLYYLSDAL
jgi:hypothetical protein